MCDGFFKVLLPCPIMVARGLRSPTAGAHAASGRTPSGPRCRAPRLTSARPPIPIPRTPRTTGARTGDRTSEPWTLPGAPREWDAQDDSLPGKYILTLCPSFNALTVPSRPGSGWAPLVPRTGASSTALRRTVEAAAVRGSGAPTPAAETSAATCRSSSEAVASAGAAAGGGRPRRPPRCRGSART